MTTSLEATRAEIQRFLSGSEPEVLCVTGEWGVGKTYLWHSVLKDLSRSSNGLGLRQYSYVSLFGLSSLDDVKFSMFENMDWLDPDPTSLMQLGEAKSKAFAKRAKRLVGLAEALPTVGQFLSKGRPLYFSLIKNQIVCIDDLERRSKNVELKDVLGLASFLREQRGCKVVFLFNAEKLDEKKSEYELLSEKVIETKVVLAPTAAESAAIALPFQDKVSVALRAHCETIGIQNIRAIKRIDRIARRVDDLLVDFSQAVRDQATHSLVLFAWSKYVPEQSPPMDFYKQSSLERAIYKRDPKEPRPKEEVAWEILLDNYQFGRADDFDLALMRYVDSMVLDVDDIRKQASALRERQRLRELERIYEAAWQPFHDSFDDDEDAIVQSIVEGAKKSVEVVSLRDLNAAIVFLKELDRDTEASDLLNFYIRNHTEANYWEHRAVRDESLDPGVKAIIDEKKSAEPHEFDLSAALVTAAANYDRDIIAKLAAVPAQSYFDLISSTRGAQLRLLVSSAFSFKQIANASDDMKRVITLMEEALRRVGAKSRVNAIRVRRYDISLDG